MSSSDSFAFPMLQKGFEGFSHRVNGGARSEPQAVPPRMPYVEFRRAEQLRQATLAERARLRKLGGEDFGEPFQVRCARPLDPVGHRFHSILESDEMDPCPAELLVPSREHTRDRVNVAGWNDTQRLLGMCVLFGAGQEQRLL